MGDDKPTTDLRRSMRMQQECLAAVVQRLEALEGSSLERRLDALEMQSLTGSSSMQLALGSSQRSDGNNEEAGALHQFSSRLERLQCNVQRIMRSPPWVHDVIDDLERRQEGINQHLRNRLSGLEEHIKLMDQAKHTQLRKQNNSSFCGEVFGCFELQGSTSRAPVACSEPSGQEEADDSMPPKQKQNVHGSNGDADAANATVIADGTWDQSEGSLVTHALPDAALEHVQRLSI